MASNMAWDGLDHRTLLVVLGIDARRHSQKRGRNGDEGEGAP